MRIRLIGHLLATYRDLLPRKLGLPGLKSNQNRARQLPSASRRNSWCSFSCTLAKDGADPRRRSSTSDDEPGASTLSTGYGTKVPGTVANATEPTAATSPSRVTYPRSPPDHRRRDPCWTRQAPTVAKSASATSTRSISIHRRRFSVGTRIRCTRMPPPPLGCPRDLLLIARRAARSSVMPSRGASRRACARRLS